MLLWALLLTLLVLSILAWVNQIVFTLFAGSNVNSTTISIINEDTTLTSTDLQITVADQGSGSLLLSTPQDIDSESSLVFSSLNVAQADAYIPIVSGESNISATWTSKGYWVSNGNNVTLFLTLVTSSGSVDATPCSLDCSLPLRAPISSTNETLQSTIQISQGGTGHVTYTNDNFRLVMDNWSTNPFSVKLWITACIQYTTSGVIVASELEEDTVDTIVTLDNVEPEALAYTRRSGAQSLTSTLTVSATNTITQAVITMSNFQSDQDVLAFTNQLGITGSWDSGSGILTLTGSGSGSDYQTALRSITYNNSDETPTIVSTRSVTIACTGSNTVTRNISVNSGSFGSVSDRITPSGAVAMSAIALSSDGSTMVVSNSTHDGIGAVWVFVRTGSAWSQQGGLLYPSDVTGSSNVGRSVAISDDGNTIAFGSVADDSNVGAAWVFTRSEETWSQQGTKLVGTDRVGVSEQGQHVALSQDGNTLAVGGPADNTNVGAVWVYTRSGSTWSQQGSKLVGTGYVGTCYQGRALSLSADGNTLAAGTELDNVNKGAIWIFTRSEGTWSQQGSKLTCEDSLTQSSRFGQFVRLSDDGNTLAASGYSRGIWLFTREGEVWTEQQFILYLPDDPDIAFTGNILAFSFRWEDQLHIYDRTDNTWSEVQILDYSANHDNNLRLCMSRDGWYMAMATTSDDGIGVWVFARS